MSILTIIRRAFPDIEELRQGQILSKGNSVGHIITVSIEKGQSPATVIHGFKQALKHDTSFRVGVYPIAEPSSTGQRIIQFSVLRDAGWKPKLDVYQHGK